MFLGLSHNLLVITIVYVYGYYGLPSSGNGISLTFHLLARADCRESVIGRPISGLPEPR